MIKFMLLRSWETGTETIPPFYTCRDLEVCSSSQEKEQQSWTQAGEGWVGALIQGHPPKCLQFKVSHEILSLKTEKQTKPQISSTGLLAIKGLTAKSSL